MQQQQKKKQVEKWNWYTLEALSRENQVKIQKMLKSSLIFMYISLLYKLLLRQSKSVKSIK